MVRVTFMFEPDEPDDNDRTGLSEAEFERLMELLMDVGAENIEVRRVD